MRAKSWQLGALLLHTSDRAFSWRSLVAVALLLNGCVGPTVDGTKSEATTHSGIRFDLLDGRRGPEFNHFNGMSGEYHFAAIFGPGVGLLDYDQDGDLDLDLVQGGRLRSGLDFAAAAPQPHELLPLSDRLFRNDLEPGNPTSLRFTDVTEEAGIAAFGYGMGVATGDYDGDGWTDLYVTNYGSNQLWHNEGDGTFSDATSRTGVDGDRLSVAATFFDYDGDARLDLYVGNYVAFDPADTVVCEDLTGARDYCGPDRFASQPDRLFNNRADGTFADATSALGVGIAPLPALGVAASDLDRDGDLDLYVANDDQPNLLFINGGDGTFSESAMINGCALNAASEAEAGMGVDSGDFDSDGDFDLFVVHLKQQTNTLYVNDSSAACDDRTDIAGLAAASLPFTSFGAAWADLNKDGSLDLAVVNGSIVRLPTLAERGDPFPLHQPNQIFHNRGDGRFEDVSDRTGAALGLSEVSRGLGVGDLDNDGDPDLVVGNNNGPVRVLINETRVENHWLGLELLTGNPQRHALGAVAALVRDGRPILTREVRVDGSYASSGDPRLLFGLGGWPETETLRVTWSDGSTDEWDDLAANRYHRLAQGSGRRPQ